MVASWNRLDLVIGNARYNIMLLQFCLSFLFVISHKHYNRREDAVTFEKCHLVRLIPDVEGTRMKFE